MIRVTYTDGHIANYATLAATHRDLKAMGFVFTHDGDLLDGGDHTLVWENKRDYMDDLDGQRVIAVILKIEG